VVGGIKMHNHNQEEVARLFRIVDEGLHPHADLIVRLTTLIFTIKKRSEELLVSECVAFMLLGPEEDHTLFESMAGACQRKHWRDVEKSRRNAFDRYCEVRGI